MTSFTGTEFNALYPSTNFYKFTNATNKHYNMTYVDGENVDINTFNESSNGHKTGLYFFEECNWYYHYKSKYTHIRRVTIPDDAIVVIRDTSFRANKIFVGPSKEFGEELELFCTFAKISTEYFREELYNKIVNSQHDRKSKLNAIVKLLSILKKVYINNTFFPDNEVYEAITQYPQIILSIPNVSLEIYKHAAILDKSLFDHIFNKIYTTIENTENMSGVFNVYEAKNNFHLMVMDILEKHTSLIPKYVSYLTPNFVLRLIQNDPSNFKIIPKNLQTEEICKIALINNIKNFQYMDAKFAYLLKVNI